MKKFLSNNKFIIALLFIVVFLSYGQTLLMHVWQDDNALFFKLANIEGRAGYLGAGPFGDGAYKYTVTPYIPIYQIFGYNTLPYFIVTWFFYLVSTVVVYKVFYKVLDEKKYGLMAGFLYACGFIASDGYIRLFNSIITSVSIMGISLMILCYWFYQKNHKFRKIDFKISNVTHPKLWLVCNFKWYILAFLSFWLVVELARARAHYLIAPIIFFELLFLTFKRHNRSIFFSVLRIIPFLLVFYFYFVSNSDHRSGQVLVFVTGLLKGEIYQLYGLLSSLTNLIFPTWLIDNIGISYLPTIRFIILTIYFLLMFVLLKSKKNAKVLIFLLGFLSIIWFFIAYKSFDTPILNLNTAQTFKTFIGGLIILTFIPISIAVQKNKKLLIFFFFLLVCNIGAYAAYSPTVSYESINRYLAHSFLMLVGIWALLVQTISLRYKKILVIFVVIWGLGNLYAAINYQTNILNHRSYPAERFYEQLKSYLPSISKGDIFYFNVADDRKGDFQEAFSVAQMPETTAIAWRYGVDRYDLKMVTSFNDLIKEINQDKTPLEQIHAYWYSKEGLVDTSHQLRTLISSPSQRLAVPLNKSYIQDTNLKNQSGKTIWEPAELIIPLKDLSSLVPQSVIFKIKANLADTNKITFPLQKNGSRVLTPNEEAIKAQAIKYQAMKNSLKVDSKYTVSSNWRERVGVNLNDNDTNTVWQADRLKWRNEKAIIVMELSKQMNINRLVWVNGFANNSPTKYTIDVSMDNNNWTQVASYSKVERIEPEKKNVVSFDPLETKYIRMIIESTLNNDSPGISEIWVVPTEFAQINIEQVDGVIDNPFDYISDKNQYISVLDLLDNIGLIQVYWLSSNHESWQTTVDSHLRLEYDGLPHEYRVKIPADGTYISQIKISRPVIPGRLTVEDLSVEYERLISY